MKLYGTLIGIVLLTFIFENSASQENYEIQVLHNSMDIDIGKPAIIMPGQLIPSISIQPLFDGILNSTIIYEEDNSIVNTITNFPLNENLNQVLNFSEQLTKIGRYRIDLVITSNANQSFYESFYFSLLNISKIPRWFSTIVNSDDNGKLRYIPDYRGNHIPDFSTAGYKGGGVILPFVPSKIVLDPEPGDDTDRIQKAIDYVSSLSKDANGFRGAIQLSKGIYEVDSTLEIKASGVILRGTGSGEIRNRWLDPSEGLNLEEFRNSLRGINATLIIATGKSRRPLINVVGQSEISGILDSRSEIIDQYIPVGSKSFRIENPERFKVGDKIIIQRTGNSNWITEIGMDRIPRSPAVGSSPPVQWREFNINFENTITEIKGNTITVKGSILCAIEKKWGGGRIYTYTDERINNIGIESLRAISFWETDQYGSDGTNHSDIFLTMTNTADSWAKDLALEHFFSLQGAVNISSGSRQITIQNSSNLIAESDYYSGPGYRHDRINNTTNVEVGRYGFHIRGQSVLVVGCYARNNRRAFVVGPRVPGPTVFLDCKADNSLSTSEPHHRWSVGGLYDNVHDNISITNRYYHGTGQGWAGANYVAWNTRGNLIIQRPPTAQNWSVGHKGEKLKNAFLDFDFEAGYWEKDGLYVLPRSLYLQQLRDRIDEFESGKLGFNSVQPNRFRTNLNVSNFPNPADYFTIFAFRIEQRYKINMSVFSNTGILVAKVDFGWRDKGYHEILWETTDDSGQPLGNGMYIYQININNHSLSNKLIINR